VLGEDVVEAKTPTLNEEGRLILLSTDQLDAFHVWGLTTAELLTWTLDQPVEFLQLMAPGMAHYAPCLRPYQNYARIFGVNPPPAAERALKVCANLHRWGARLTPLQLDVLEDVARGMTATELQIMLGHDPWLLNFVRSVWEYVHGITELESCPWNISLPIADICNARCTFCTAWFDGRNLVKLEQIEAFAEVISRSLYIGLVGHGEPLAHPQFDKICDIIAKHIDPRATTYTITNGVYLQKWMDRIEQINVESFSISLNAASAETHNTVMGLGPDAFDQVIASLRTIIEGSKSRGGGAQVNITMVVTQQNVHEIADFIRLGNELGVVSIWLRSLLPQSNLIPGLNYHLLPPSLHPDFARLKEEALQAIAESKVPVHADPATWDIEIFPPQVKAAIEAQPPAVTPREQTLRDKALRRRTDEVYSAAAALRLGRKAEASEFTDVTWQDGGAQIRTMQKAWNMALSVPMDPGGVIAGPFRLAIPVARAKGKLGLGLWDQAGREWLDRAFVEPGQDGEVRLAVDNPRAGLTLIVENASEHGASEGFVGEPRLEVQSGDGAWAAGPAVRLSAGTVHGALDPMDDGTNPLGRTPRFACKAVYYNLYVNEMYFRVVPCCYMSNVPGYEEIRFDGSVPFDQAWNAPAMIELRRRLRDGPLLAACRRCPENW
jgi:pyruvate-formate lyase-activating enzyme